MHEFIITIKSPYIEYFGPNAGIRNGMFGGYYLSFERISEALKITS